LSHRLKSLKDLGKVVGTTALPSSNDINGCDGFKAVKNPAETAPNPKNCRTCPECFGKGYIKLWPPGHPERAIMARCEQCSGLTQQLLGRSHTARLGAPVR
jgi:hypothetical protein